MAGFLLPLLGYGATALGAAAGGVGLYSGYEDLKDKYTRKAYEDGPDIDGNFDTGSFVGNIIVDEESQRFKDRFLPTARRYDQELNQMMTVLGDKFQKGDGKQSIQQLKDLNRQGARLAEQEQNQELEKGTTAYKRAEAALQFERDKYNDRLRLEQQTRADQMMFNADQLALQRDRLMLEDQRYNERLDREERNRRQESIMAMMSGLASLGAAFAM